MGKKKSQKRWDAVQDCFRNIVLSLAEPQSPDKGLRQHSVLIGHTRREEWGPILLQHGGGSHRTPLTVVHQLCTVAVLSVFPVNRGQ